MRLRRLRVMAPFMLASFAVGVLAGAGMLGAVLATSDVPFGYVDPNQKLWTRGLENRRVIILGVDPKSKVSSMTYGGGQGPEVCVYKYQEEAKMRIALDLVIHALHGDCVCRELGK